VELARGIEPPTGGLQKASEHKHVDLRKPEKPLDSAELLKDCPL
jgi:hypothetical protein